MITLSQLVECYQPELERLHGQQLLPSHRQALRAMRRCRRQASEQMLLECKPCGTTMKISHSCGHRSCPIASIMTASSGLKYSQPNYYQLSISWGRVPLRGVKPEARMP